MGNCFSTKAHTDLDLLSSSVSVADLNAPAPTPYLYRGLQNDTDRQNQSHTYRSPLQAPQGDLNGSDHYTGAHEKHRTAQNAVGTQSVPGIGQKEGELLIITYDIGTTACKSLPRQSTDLSWLCLLVQGSGGADNFRSRGD